MLFLHNAGSSRKLKKGAAHGDKEPICPGIWRSAEGEPMRVRRTYSGGTGIDRWHNEAGRFGLERPEEWLASVTPLLMLW